MTDSFPSKEVLRKKLLKFTMYEGYNPEARNEGQKLYNYLENADTRTKKVRQTVLNRLKSLSEFEDCENCEPMFKNTDTLKTTWQKKSHITEGVKPVKTVLKDHLKRFVSTEPSSVKTKGQEILDKLDTIDIRKESEKQAIYTKLDSITHADDCKTCDTLMSVKNEVKKRFWQ